MLTLKVRLWVFCNQLKFDDDLGIKISNTKQRCIRNIYNIVLGENGFKMSNLTKTF